MDRFRRQSSLYLSYLLLSTILVQVIAASNGYPEEYTNSDGLIDMKVANSSEVVRQYGYAKAYFGDPFSDNPAEYSVGMIHTANPIDGCTQLESPPDDTELWVALIERSGAPGSSRTCTFIEKVYNAQLAGYGIVIIYDYVKNAELEEMYSNNESLEKLVNIPSAFVAYGTGMDMKARSYPDSQAVMSSVMFRPFKEDILDPYKILIPMAFSFVGILLVAVIIMIVRWCQALRRRRRSRISKSQLKKIPLVKYKKEDQYDCCAICLDDYVEGEKVRLLPCSHTYHRKCIDPWLLKNKRTCPVCKRRVVPRKPRRTRRADDSSSDSEFEAGHNERRPLLPPPHHESGDEEAGYGAVGYRPQTEGSERQSTSSSRPGSSNSTRHNRAQDILYERAYTPHSTDSDSSDDGADLRHPATLFAQRRPSNSINAGEHSLRSWPTRSTVEEYMPRIPPLNNTATEAPQQAESPVATERSHDELVAMDPSHDQPEVVIEAPRQDSDEEMQAVITPTASNQNDII